MRKAIVLVIVLILMLSIVVAQEEQKTLKTSSAGASGGGQKDTGLTKLLVGTMKAGEVKEFKLNKKALPVSKLSLKSRKKYIGDAEINIRRTFDFPSKQIPRLPDANAYFEVNTVNLNSEIFTDFKIEFYLEKQWLEIRKLKEQDIALYRLYKGMWVELDTEFVRSENFRRYFVAETPGFSYFGIAQSGLGYREVNEEPVENNTAEPDGQEEENQTQQDNEEETFEEEIEDIIPDTDEIKQNTGSTLKYWATIIAIMLAFYLISRYKAST